MSRARFKRPARAAALLLFAALGGTGCDSFDAPAEPPPSVSATITKANNDVRDTVTQLMEAARTVSASCQAGELIWEADPSGYVVPRHFSRPCLPEVCDPKPAEVAALKAAIDALAKQIDAQPALQVPSYQGLLALARAMSGFLDTALDGIEKAEAAAAAAGKGKLIKGPIRWAANPLADKSGAVKRNSSPLSGLSLHDQALAVAYRELYPDTKLPLENPALSKSLQSAEPGGDPCKGWALPQYCDVKAVRIPEKRRWRTDPACLEVEGVPK